VQLLEQLNSMGIDEHLSSSFTANEYYFAHDATKIASGFLSQEQKPINLFDKLVEFENRINYLQEIIDKVTGELVVKILDDTGAETLIENNSANKFFAGYYLDEVKDRDIKKGSIVTKQHLLKLYQECQVIETLNSQCQVHYLVILVLMFQLQVIHIIQHAVNMIEFRYYI
jgi:hypothetical protein